VHATSPSISLQDPAASRSRYRLVVLVLLWAAATAIAMFFALIISDSAVLGDVYIPRTNDSFYHARRILDAAVGSTGLYQFEPRIDPPTGIWIPWPWGYDYTMAVLLRAALLFSPDADPMAVLSHIPVAWIAINAALFLAAASALGLSLGMRALVMAAFALSPLTQLLHGIAMIDHHFVEHSFVLLGIWLGLAWMNRRTDIRPAIGLGIALGAAPAFHTGLFLLQLIPLATLGALWLRGEMPPRRTVLCFAGALALTTLLAVIPAETFRRGMFAFGYLSWFHLYVSICTALVAAGLACTARSLRSGAAVALLACALAVPLLAQTLVGATFISGDLSVLRNISEAHSPLRMILETMGPQETISYYSWLLLLTPVVLIFGLYTLLTDSRPRRLYFAAASVLGIGLMLAQFRFYYFGLFALIAGTFLIIDLLRSSRGWHRGAVFVGAFGLLALAYQPALQQRLFTIFAISADPDYETAIALYFKLGEVCAEDPGLVLASNNEGNAILFHSDCSVVANNFFLDASDQEKIDRIAGLMTSSPANLLAVEPPIRYLFLRRGNFSVPTDDGPRVDTRNRIVSEILLAASPPPGFELLTTVYTKDRPDAEPEIHARLYRLSPGGDAN
jgi:hypothetical protein